MTEASQPGPRHAEAGFTLIEALTAIVVLSFGLIAVSNLFLVAGSSNKVANESTAAAADASEVLERLKAIPFTQLVEGGDLDNNVGNLPDCEMSTQQCVVPGNFNALRALQGVAPVRTRWLIRRPGAGSPDTLFIVVRSESEAPLGFRRTRAEFTSFRTCTATGCP